MNKVNAILPKSLAIVNRFLQRSDISLLFSLDNDPLEINLPAYSGGGSSIVNREILEVLAALYFQAELEQAGIIPIAELLTENRFNLQLRDAEAANMFEQFSIRLRSAWYTRQIREQIFARTFGSGAQATNEAGATVNRNFETLFAQACYALLRYQSLRHSNSLPGTYVVQLEVALKNLFQNLGGRVFGNTPSASNKIQEQLQMAIDLLNHHGVTSLFQARNMWQLIGNILGADAPDHQRIITRAQSGLRIIGWMSENLTAIQEGRLDSVLLSQTALYLWAASWLQASGLEYENTQSAYGDYQNSMFRQANRSAY